jgi:hypothetical protein
VTPAFTINFRREAYRQELARTRRRAVAVGTWVAYFGLLAVVIGLYGLNCSSLIQRARLLRDQTVRLQASHDPSRDWTPGTAELAQVERALANPGRWKIRLTRLAAILPANAMLTSVAANPDNLGATGDQERLVLSGVLRPVPGQDRMQGIMALVAALHADSSFTAQYRTIRLLTSRVGGGADAPAEFQIECR